MSRSTVGAAGGARIGAATRLRALGFRRSPDALGAREEDHLRMPLRATLLPIALLALAASSCGAQGVDKAGGTKPQKPLVLTLASHDDDETAYAPFAAAVKRLSGGAMQIRVETGWEGTQDAREI